MELGISDDCTAPVLGIGFLQQSAPELVALLGVSEDQASVDGRQEVVDDHVDPLAEAPEAEVEGPGVVFGRIQLVPFLIFVVGYHLHTDDVSWLGGKQSDRFDVRTTLFHNSLQPARTEQAATNQQFPKRP